MLSSLLADSMIRASARSRNTHPRPAAASRPSTWYARSSASRNPQPGGPDRQRTTDRWPEPQVELRLPDGDPLACRGLQRLQFGVVVR